MLARAGSDVEQGAAVWVEKTQTREAEWAELADAFDVKNGKEEGWADGDILY